MGRSLTRYAKWPSSPCAECPFTPNGVKLRNGRVRELLSLMGTDGHFHCHKTLNLPSTHRAGCAGFNIMTYRIHQRVPQIARIAARMGLLDLGALLNNANSKTCAAFMNARAMKESHAKANRVTGKEIT